MLSVPFFYCNAECSYAESHAFPSIVILNEKHTVSCANLSKNINSCIDYKISYDLIQNETVSSMLSCFQGRCWCFSGVVSSSNQPILNYNRNKNWE
jgi:hypothetical protein